MLRVCSESEEIQRHLFRMIILLLGIWTGRHDCLPTFKWRSRVWSMVSGVDGIKLGLHDNSALACLDAYMQ